MGGLTWCILGGGGSFAINLAHHLFDVAEPKEVIGIGRSPLGPEAFNLGVTRRGYTYYVRHLVSEQEGALDILNHVQPDIIVNFAAQGEGAASWKDSWRFFETNATALVKLVEALGQPTWLKRFIQIGSSEIYGSASAALDEEAPIKPSSPYAASKAAFDLHLMAVHKHLGYPMNILRPSNCYGPGQLLHRIIPKAIVSGLLGRTIPLQGGGVAEKSYLHSRDLARAIVRVATQAPAGEVYNVGPPRPTSIREVVERCAAAVGIEFRDLVEIAPERLGQDSRYWLDSSKIRQHLAWEPSIDWDDGLPEMVRWATVHLETLRDWPTGYELRP